MGRTSVCLACRQVRIPISHTLKQSVSHWDSRNSLLSVTNPISNPLIRCSHYQSVSIQLLYNEWQDAFTGLVDMTMFGLQLFDFAKATLKKTPPMRFYPTLISHLVSPALSSHQYFITHCVEHSHIAGILIAGIATCQFHNKSHDSLAKQAGAQIRFSKMFGCLSLRIRKDSISLVFLLWCAVARGWWTDSSCLSTFPFMFTR